MLEYASAANNDPMSTNFLSYYLSQSYMANAMANQELPVTWTNFFQLSNDMLPC